MNSRLFKSYMVKQADTLESLSNYLGMAISTLSLKINEKENSRGNKAEFTQSEILRVKDRWKLSNEEFMEIFFEKNVF